MNNYEMSGDKLPKNKLENELEKYPYLCKKFGASDVTKLRKEMGDDFIAWREKEEEMFSKVTEEMKKFTWKKMGIIISYNHVETGGWDKDNNPDIGVRIERLSAMEEDEKDYRETGKIYPLLHPKDSTVSNVGYKAWEKFINNPDSINLQDHKNYETMDEIVELIQNLEPVERN